MLNGENRKESLFRSIVKLSSVLAGVFLFLEIVSAVVLFTLSVPFFSPSFIEKEIRAVVTGEESVNPMTGQASVLHPYLGYVHDPDAKTPIQDHGPYSLNRHGYLDEIEPIQKRASDKFIVGFLGGSVAWWLSHEGFESFRSELSKSTAIKGKTIVPVRLALGGYKQPQQLFSFLYHSALGGEFDMIVNLDGFNEVTLPKIGNVGKNISPFYPTYWGDLNVNFQDSRESKKLGKLVMLEELQVGFSSLMLSSKAYMSSSASLFWKLSDKIFMQKISKHRASLNSEASSKQSSSYLLSGPKNFDSENIEKDLVGIWQRSSLQIDAVSKASGIVYLHFLQPNLYDADSKVLSDKELELSSSAQLWGPNVRVGYPLLREYGEKLKESGVKFFDLSKVFKDNSETLYIDDCCHLNKSGNEIMGKVIGIEARKSLAKAG